MLQEEENFELPWKWNRDFTVFTIENQTVTIIAENQQQPWILHRIPHRFHSRPSSVNKDFNIVPTKWQKNVNRTPRENFPRAGKNQFVSTEIQ